MVNVLNNTTDQVIGLRFEYVLDRVATTLVLLTTSPPYGLSNQAMVIPVVIIIGREITMSALREWAASASAAAHTVIVSFF